MLTATLLLLTAATIYELVHQIRQQNADDRLRRRVARVIERSRRQG